MAKNKSGLAAFVISLLVTLLLLGGAYFGFLIYTKAELAEKNKTDVIYEEKVFESTAEKSLSALVVFTEKTEVSPALYLTVFYDAPEGSITINAIPKETKITAGERTDTLSGHYGYEGLRGAVRAASAFEGKQIDRYLRITMRGMQNLADFLGGVSAEIENDIVTPHITIKKGEQTLDGRRIASLLLSENIALKDKESLSASLLEKNLSYILAEKYDTLKSAVFKNSETNLTSYDFTARQSSVTKQAQEKRLLIAVK